MDIKKTTRKRRQDTRHAVYCITNTATGQQYVGITVCGSAVKKALKIRFQKHIRRALTENKDWNLCRSIREYGADTHIVQLVEIVRGRKPAHARERELIRLHNPQLNTH
jgi:GIY-YIG catalytic domain